MQKKGGFEEAEMIQGVGVYVGVTVKLGREKQRSLIYCGWFKIKRWVMRQKSNCLFSEEQLEKGCTIAFEFKH